MNTQGPRPNSSPRRAFSSWGTMAGLVAAVVVPAIGLSIFARFRGQSEEAGPMMHKVQKADFLHDVTERGELESASNVQILCEVKGRNTGGTTIIEIVPEGTIVKQGDLICKLDSSALDSDRLGKLIDVATAEANVIKAKTALSNAVLAKEEYILGTYVQTEKSLSADLAVANEDLRRAEEYVGYSKILKSKGYITGAQLQGDIFAVDKARNTLQACEKKYDGLKKYTLKKMTAGLQTDIEVAQAQLKAVTHSFELEKEKLEDIETQIAKCTVKAPSAGQVVYANITNTWGGREIIIEAGVTVRERQEIVRLPDHTKMQVRAKVNEGNVAMVMVGMSATVRLDAMPDRTFPARVEKVSEYPAPTNRFTSSVKEYETIVRILEPPPGCRPGLTAEVKIHLEHLADVVQVPVQAVLEHGEHHYVVMRGPEALRTHEVTLGSTNDKYVVVREGLSPGDEVVLNSTAVRNSLKLPELLPERPAAQMAAHGRPAGSADAGAQANGETASAPSTIVPAGPAAARRKDSPSNSAQLFANLDKNRDGRLQADELPPQYRAWLKTGDLNHDGVIDRTEWAALAAAKTGPRPRGEGKPPRAGL